ncbi:MAG: hypothetical protein R3A79_24910 [Nannocystaceae bacterium]
MSIPRRGRSCGRRRASASARRRGSRRPPGGLGRGDPRFEEDGHAPLRADAAVVGGEGVGRAHGRELVEEDEILATAAAVEHLDRGGAPHLRGLPRLKEERREADAAGDEELRATSARGREAAPERTCDGHRRPDLGGGEAGGAAPEDLGEDRQAARALHLKIEKARG